MPADPPVKRTIDKANAPKAGAPKVGATKAAAPPPKAKLAAKAKVAPKAAAPKAPAVKVKLTKPVVDMIKWMNEHGEMGKELRLGAVAVLLAALSPDDALDVLEACLDFPSGRKDPIPFVKEAAKELALQAEANKSVLVAQEHNADEDTLCERLNEDNIVDWTVQGEESKMVVGRCPPLSPGVLEHVDRLTHVGALPKTVESDKLGAFLAFLSEGPAIDILSDFEDGPAIDPKEFIVRAAAPILTADRGSDFARRVSQRMRWMNFNLGFLSPLEVSQAAYELAWIGERAALQVLKRMVKGATVGHLFADPTEWICKESRILSGEEKRAEPIKDGEENKENAEGGAPEAAPGTPPELSAIKDGEKKTEGGAPKAAPGTPPELSAIKDGEKKTEGGTPKAAPGTPPELSAIKDAPMDVDQEEKKTDGVAKNSAPGTPPEISAASAAPGTPPEIGAGVSAAPGTPPEIGDSMDVDQEGKATEGEGQAKEGQEPPPTEEDFSDVPIA